MVTISTPRQNDAIRRFISDVDRRETFERVRVRAVSGAENAAMDHTVRYRLQIVGQSQIVERMNYSGDWRVWSDEPDGTVKFGGAVVPRKDVVVIVPSFAHRQVHHHMTIGRIDVLVVRVLAPQVSGTVDQPGDVKQHDVAEYVHEKGVLQRFAPEIPGDESGNSESEYGDNR